MASVSDPNIFVWVFHVGVGLCLIRNSASLCHKLHQPVWRAKSRRASSQLLLASQASFRAQTNFEVNECKHISSEEQLFQKLRVCGHHAKASVPYKEVFIISIFSFGSLSPASNDLLVASGIFGIVGFFTPLTVTSEDSNFQLKSVTDSYILYSTEIAIFQAVVFYTVSGKVSKTVL